MPALALIPVAGLVAYGTVLCATANVNNAEQDLVTQPGELKLPTRGRGGLAFAELRSAGQPGAAVPTWVVALCKIF